MATEVFGFNYPENCLHYTRRLGRWGRGRAPSPTECSEKQTGCRLSALSILFPVPSLQGNDPEGLASLCIYLVLFFIFVSLTNSVYSRHHTAAARQDKEEALDKNDLPS